MLRSASVLLLVAVGATAVSAQNVAIIKERKTTTRRWARPSKEPNAMYKGDEEFDLAKVQAALKVIQEKAAILPKLFPDDSKTGDDTEALPIIWQEKKDFDGPLPEARRRRQGCRDQDHRRGDLSRTLEGSDGQLQRLPQEVPQAEGQMTPTARRPPERAPAWDLPTRLFHWTLVALIVSCLGELRVCGGDRRRDARLAPRERACGPDVARVADPVGPGRLVYCAVLLVREGPSGSARLPREVSLRGAETRFLGHNPLGALHGAGAPRRDRSRKGRSGSSPSTTTISPAARSTASSTRRRTSGRPAGTDAASTS